MESSDKVPMGHRNRETRRPNTTVDVTASEGTTMARRNELEVTSHSGKLARRVLRGAAAGTAARGGSLFCPARAAGSSATI